MADPTLEFFKLNLFQLWATTNTGIWVCFTKELGPIAIETNKKCDNQCLFNVSLIFFLSYWFRNSYKERKHTVRTKNQQYMITEFHWIIVQNP